MLETRAIVVSVDGQRAQVRASQVNGCEQCKGKGCGTGKLAGLFCSKPRQFKVNNPIKAGVGDKVIVSVAEGAIMRGISMVYLMPLALLVMGATFGNFLAQHPGQQDSYAAVGAMFGLTVGFVVAKWISFRQTGPCFQPYIARLWYEEMQGSGE